jgi:MerR family transcriptional regulator, heat shock protein HspR
VQTIYVCRHSFLIAHSACCRKWQVKVFRGRRRLTGDSVARSTRGVYGIAVTSELSGVAQQTLRLYERRGLLTPARTDGGARRYSDDDLERLGRITELVGQGVNPAGIAQILVLETKNSQLQT